MVDLPKPFTFEEDEIIRNHASQGKLARECAAALGRTKSSILGRASRLKISFQRELIIKFVDPINENVDKLNKRPFRFFSYLPKPQIQPRYEQPETATTPFGKPRELLNLQEKHCRWPCFENEDGKQMFCCAERMSNKPYCVDHQALVYIKKTFAEVKV